MRKANTQIVSTIKTKTLELLMKKNPDSISMRDIAANCSITAANIYHYYKDKDSLFQEISLDCLHELNERILNRVQNLSADKKKLQTAAHTFRDWCFENPRRALLVIQGIKTSAAAGNEFRESYFVCNKAATEVLKACVQSGSARSANPQLDVDILVSGLWGCVEAVFLKKCNKKYWDNGSAYMNRFIDLWINAIFGGTK
ncbi:TetR/AcrR family transcriptional regulator [Treponema lecithinolyticum]